MAEVLTFLFADMEGSTRLWEEDPEGMRRTLASHDALLREAIESHEGVVFKTTGDGALAAFADPAQAVAAALDAQRALADLPVRIRMALHAGVVEERDGDYHGPVLNRAARLLGAGHGGQVLLTRAVVELVRESSLPEGSGLRDLGEHRLKDLTHPERVFQLDQPDLPQDFPPLRTMESVANNLPLQLSSFVGRQRELKEVLDLLASSRLLTLVGVGGTGKTRLALQAAAEALEWFPDGVWLVELATLGDPDLVEQTLAGVLGIRQHAGRSAFEMLLDALQSKRMLLVLDNCEHLLDAAASVAQRILQGAPSVGILATSREGLGLPGEVLWTVPSMDVSEGQGDAIGLFAERAAAVRPAFRLDEEVGPLVAQICERLDGLPLAIELAASRVRALPLSEIAGRLDDRFRLLTGGRRGLARQQTLLATVDWSYDLLGEEERELFGRLSVFFGGWTLETAESVCGPEVDVFDLLPRLVDRSLVGLDDRGRYRMLETLRQYSREKLVESGNAELMQQRHAGYFLVFAETAESGLQGPEQLRWLERLSADHDNLRVALDWSSAEERTTALRLDAALWRFWFLRGHWTEGRRRLEEVLQLADQPREARIVALVGFSLLSGTQGEFEASLQSAEEAVAEARGLGDERLLSRALTMLGSVSINWQTDPQRAERSLRESLKAAKAAGDPWLVADATQELGEAMVVQGRYEEGTRLHEEALELWQAQGDRIRLADSRFGLAIAARFQGDLEKAAMLTEESRRSFEDLGDQAMVAHAEAAAGAVARYRGDFVEAGRLLSRAKEQLGRFGDRGCTALVNLRLGALALDQDRPDQAWGPLRDALVALSEMKEPERLTTGLEVAARLAAVSGQPARATTLLAAAESQRELIGAPLPAAERDRYRALHASLEGSLPPDVYRKAWDQGSVLDLGEAVDYALAND